MKSKIPAIISLLFGLFLSFGQSVWARPLMCYNLFSRGAGPFPDWHRKLQSASDMHFNCIWLNPFQKTGEIQVRRMLKDTGEWEKNAPVQSSLYAMADPYEFERGIGGSESREEIVAKVREFTDAARAKKVQPMFDLVLNHLAAEVLPM